MINSPLPKPLPPAGSSARWRPCQFGSTRKASPESSPRKESPSPSALSPSAMSLCSTTLENSSTSVWECDGCFPREAGIPLNPENRGRDAQPRRLSQHGRGAPPRDPQLPQGEAPLRKPLVLLDIPLLPFMQAQIEPLCETCPWTLLHNAVSQTM